MVDVLYQRWGSFPNFQRTRGVLRLLSLVIHTLKDKSIPYISSADFDLGHQEIRRELLKHIGQEYDSVVAADITGQESGSRKVDLALGDAYKGLKLGTRTATTVFLYSFSGGIERGSSLGEIKRSATTTGNPASAIAEALEQLKGRLFFLQHQSGKYYFTNQPNLNRILLTKMENVGDEEIEDLEKELWRKNISGKTLRVFPEEGTDIPDNMDLKLVLFKTRKQALMKQLLEMKGSTPRVYRNTLFFLAPLESERAGFYNLLKKAIAYRRIDSDKTLHLSDEQQKEIKTELKRIEESLNEALRRYYRLVFIPDKAGLKEKDLGIPTYGGSKKIDEEIYEKLRSDGEILERLSPLVIKERYLKNNPFVSTEQLYQSSGKTPGEMRVTDREVWEKGLAEGVKQGLFGLGDLENGQPVCRFFREDASIALSSNEIILREDLCLRKEKEEPAVYQEGVTGDKPPRVHEVTGKPQPVSPASPSTGRREVRLRFTLPKGKVSGIMGVMNLLQAHFDKLKIELLAEGGEISEQAYEDKVREAFRQLGIEINEEKR